MFQLPETAKTLLAFLITNGIKALLGLFDIELAGKAAAIVASLVAAILFFIEGILAGVPEAQEIVVQVLSLIAMILSAFGIHYSVKEYL